MDLPNHKWILTSSVYFKNAVEQCERGHTLYGNVSDIDALKQNMEENCIPSNIVNMDYSNYPEFLIARRKMMAAKIKSYYYSL